MPFTSAMLAPLAAEESEMLINQAGVGLGDESAGIIFVGAEHAHDCHQKAVNFALEACALSSLWLCGGKNEITGRVAGWSKGHAYPFIRRPDLYYPTVGPGHVWRKVEAVLTRAGLPGPFGVHSYLVELSAFPSVEHVGGKMPTAERIDFLHFLLEELRTTAKVVVFYLPRRVEARIHRNTLGSVFLGMNLGVATGSRSLKNKQRMLELEWWDSPDGRRRVIFSEFLGGSAGITDQYLDEVAELIRNVV